MGAVIVIDSFWGDSGKGKIAAWMSKRDNALVCARAGIGTNAGHSIYMSDGELIKTRQLPLGFMNPDTQIVIGSGVAVDPEVFADEVERYGLADRVKVDYRCPVILPEHRERETANAHLSETVGSTKSGSGAARVDFILRKNKQARDIDSLKPYADDVAKIVNEAAAEGLVIVECSQGTYLSLALSPDYPFVTSDNCTAAAAADDVGLNWQLIDGCCLIVKAVPSRVGEGPLPGELDPEEIKKRGIDEYGVVTGRLRRKAESIPYDMLRYACMLNGPTEIAVTFMDHYDPECANAVTPDQITQKAWDLIKTIEKETGVPVTIVETGKLFDHIVDIKDVPRP